MESKIIEYERKIEALEKKVFELEKYNADLRESFLKNVQFSTKLSNITYEMDCLLVKKGQEIRDLEIKLEQSLARLESVQDPVKQELEDFDMDMGFEKDYDTEALNSQLLDVNDYVESFSSKKLGLEKDSNGHFNCDECTYKTVTLRRFELHYRMHTDERPFGCKLCQKRFRTKNVCINHIRSHDDRFKLQCSVCRAKFSKSGDILRHVENLHGGKGYERKNRNLKRKRQSSCVCGKCVCVE